MINALSPSPESLYRNMYRARKFDQIAVALQRQGAISGYAQAAGQEAVQVAVAAVARDSDMVFPSYRQPAAALARGVGVHDLLRFHARESYSPWDWRSLGFGPYTIPVGTQLAHATGWAVAESRRRTDSVTFAFFGDGASSQGETHEAMNMAGVFDAPVVFVCENNGWAISTPFERQTRASTLYVRALGYGFSGVQVDGNDVERVQTALHRAADRARTGGGPSLIEATTYRLGGHTTSDDPTLYRPIGEVDRWAALDPIHRYRDVLIARGVEEGDIQAWEREVDTALDATVDEFLAHGGQTP